MNMEMPKNDPAKKDWSGFWNRVQESGNQAGKNLERALEYVVQKDEALDLGAGTLRDSKRLLEVGFRHVTAVDASVDFKNYNQENNPNIIADNRLDLIESTFDTFDFKANTYDLINARSALRFNSRQTFYGMFTSLKNSLKKDGILSFDIDSAEHFANTPDRDQTFLTEEVTKELVQDMKVLFFEPYVYQKRIDNGEIIPWPGFMIIAQKI